MTMIILFAILSSQQNFLYHIYHSETYLGFSHTSKMENFETIIRGWNLSIIFENLSISDVLGVLTTPLLFTAPSSC